MTSGPASVARRCAAAVVILIVTLGTAS